MQHARGAKPSPLRNYCFEFFPGLSIFPFLFIKALLSHLQYKIKKPWWSCFSLYVQKKQWLIVWLTCPDKIWRAFRCVRVCVCVRVCSCMHTPAPYIFVGQFRQLTFFLLLQKMNITYIFKYSLPRKAKEKGNKLFAKDTAGGIVLGDANHRSSLRPLEVIKIDITRIENLSFWVLLFELHKIISSLGLCYFLFVFIS